MLNAKEKSKDKIASSSRERACSPKFDEDGNGHVSSGMSLRHDRLGGTTTQNHVTWGAVGGWRAILMRALTLHPR